MCPIAKILISGYYISINSKKYLISGVKFRKEDLVRLLSGGNFSLKLLLYTITFDNFVNCN